MGKQKKGTALGIILLTLLGCAGMALVDGVIRPGYAAKSAVKWVLFFLLPVAFMALRREKAFFSILKPGKKGLLTALGLGLGVYGLIMGAYLLLRRVFDFSAITGLLGQQAGVGKDNFLGVAVYISLANSLLEEFFFRGFGFLLLGEYAGRKTAYIFSSAAFAVYHVAIMTGWFSPILFFLAMAGLAAGGWIFDLLDARFGNIWCSWMVHCFANLAINTVGCILFGIL